MNPLSEIPKSVMTLAWTMFGFAMGIFCVLITMAVSS